MKKQMPGFQEISMELSARAFHVRHAISVFLKILTIMKRHLKACNKYGYVTPEDIIAANDTRKAMNHYLDIIVDEMRLTEEAFSRFMQMPEDAEKKRPQSIEDLVRRLYHESVLTLKVKQQKENLK